MDDFELESTRRSLVMANPDGRLAWTARQALEVVDELVVARQRIAELEKAEG